jgi:hypothetical protein
MTEEVQNTETAPEEQNINISVEQILAATLKQMGKTTIQLEDLIANYSTYSIAVTQNEDKSVSFELVEAPAEEPLEADVLEVEAE